MASNVGSFDELLAIVRYIDYKPENFIELVNNGLDIFRRYNRYDSNNRNRNLLESYIFACDLKHINMVILISSYYINDDFVDRYEDDSIIHFISNTILDQPFHWEELSTILTNFVEFYNRHNLFINTKTIIKRYVITIKCDIEMKIKHHSCYHRIDLRINIISKIITVLQNYDKKYKTLFELMSSELI